MTDSHPRAIADAGRALAEVLASLGLDGPPPDARPSMPLPPEALVASVNAPDKRDPSVFLASGMEDLAALLRGARAAGWQPPPEPAVLDFGCGAGRLLRHVLPWAGRVGAVDRQAPLLEWLAPHVPTIETALVSPEPHALPWPAATFDLVLANSVFTHIPLARQAGWLTDLRRVLRPGGVLVLTMLGDTHRRALLDEAQRDVLSREGALEVWPEHELETGALTAYGAVFEREDVCRARLAQAFAVQGPLVQDGRQDVWALVAPRR